MAVAQTYPRIYYAPVQGNFFLLISQLVNLANVINKQDGFVFMWCIKTRRGRALQIFFLPLLVFASS